LSPAGLNPASDYVNTTFGTAGTATVINESLPVVYLSNFFD